MRVLIIGAGIGGLVLAHGLRRAGFDVAVYDRDANAAATGGYRLHLDVDACAALSRNLSPQLYQALLASSAHRDGMRRFTLTDHRLRELGADPIDPAAETLLVGRVPLRTLLCHGLDDVLYFDSTFARFATTADGRVRAEFVDGRSDTGDLLVGADGVGSRVAGQLAGRATSAPIGLGGIAARTPLTPTTRELLPDLLTVGPVLGIEPGGMVTFLTVHDPQRPQIDPARCTEIPAVVEPASLMWGVTGAEDAFPVGLRDTDGSGLVTVACAALRRWDPMIRALLAATDPASAAWFRFHATDPDSELTPWPAGQVTALGDAVHAMPPTGGRAAATAIRDADQLVAALRPVLQGATTMPLAVHRFQRAMAGYAPEAIRVSLRPLTWQRRLAGPVASGLARAALPALTGAIALRSRR